MLRLDPLEEDEIRTLLDDRVGPGRAGELMSYAHGHGLCGFLQHPLHIELLLKAGIDSSPHQGVEACSNRLAGR